MRNRVHDADPAVYQSYFLTPWELRNYSGTEFYSTDNGLTWFNPTDSVTHCVALLMGKSGNEWIGTALYGGLPALVVRAGAHRAGEQQYLVGWPEYLEPEDQALHALFFEHVVRDMPTHDRIGTEWRWPFPQPASEMVLQRFQAAPGPGGFRNYNLYTDLFPASDSEGHEIIAFTEVVAHAMKEAVPELPTPEGF